MRQESQDQYTRQAQMDANRAAQRLRREAETPEARPIKAVVCQLSMLSSVLLGSLHLQYVEFSFMRMRCSHFHTRTSSCMHSGRGAHGPSHVVLHEMVYKQCLLQLAQARPTMPALTTNSVY